MRTRVRPDSCRGTAAAAALLTTLQLLAVGCGGPQETACPPFDSLVGPAAADSLGLDVFRTLTPEERASRRAHAREYLAAAQQASSTKQRADALLAAVGLAPDDPGPWLDLAELWRWAGDYLHAETCLQRAAAAVREWGGPGLDGPLSRSERDAAAARTAILRAWLHYDRAEWREGMRWARAAGSLGAGNKDVWQIEGLLEAAQGHRSQAHEIAGDIRRKDVFATDITWILAVLDAARGETRSAFDLLLQGGEGDANVSVLRPRREHASECWRDMAIIAERVQEWAWARRWYEEARAAVPLRSKGCIVAARGPRLGPEGQAPVMPVWLAFDHYYVTGSLSAYAALAFARFEATTGGAEREFWAGAVVNATGILLRRGEDRGWARRARGLVFAARGMPDRGLPDLRRALTQLAREGVADGRIEAAIGRLQLMKEDHIAARPHLDRAVALDPYQAEAWSDLGLAALMVGETGTARDAFDRALELAPELVTARYNRGLMSLHAGDLAGAAADLEEAARLAPDNPEVARALQELAARRRQQQPR